MEVGDFAGNGTVLLLWSCKCLDHEPPQTRRHLSFWAFRSSCSTCSGAVTWCGCRCPSCQDAKHLPNCEGGQGGGCGGTSCVSTRWARSLTSRALGTASEPWGYQSLATRPAAMWPGAAQQNGVGCSTHWTCDTSRSAHRSHGVCSHRGWAYEPRSLWCSKPWGAANGVFQEVGWFQKVSRSHKIIQAYDIYHILYIYIYIHVTLTWQGGPQVCLVGQNHVACHAVPIDADLWQCCEYACDIM